MSNLLNPVHGAVVNLVLTIVSIGTKLTKHDKLAIAVIPQAPYDGEVVLVTPEHLENMALSVGSHDRFAIANAINTGDDASQLSVVMTYKKAGERIGTKEDGSPITNANGSEVFEKSYWDASEYTLLPGVDANSSIKELNEKIDIAAGLERRKDLQANDVSARNRRLLERSRRNSGGKIEDLTQTPTPQIVDPLA